MLLVLAMRSAGRSGACGCPRSVRVQPLPLEHGALGGDQAPSSPLRTRPRRAARCGRTSRRGAGRAASHGPRGGDRPRLGGRCRGPAGGRESRRVNSSDRATPPLTGAAANPSSGSSVRSASADPAATREPVPDDHLAIGAEADRSQARGESPMLSEHEHALVVGLADQARTSGATPRTRRSAPRAAPASVAAARAGDDKGSAATPGSPDWSATLRAAGRPAAATGGRSVKPPDGRRVPLHRRAAAVAAEAVEGRIGAGRRVGVHHPDLLAGVEARSRRAA